jgi:hypothetical protein
MSFDGAPLQPLGSRVDRGEPIRRLDPHDGMQVQGPASLKSTR